MYSQLEEFTEQFANEPLCHLYYFCIEPHRDVFYLPVVSCRRLRVMERKQTVNTTTHTFSWAMNGKEKELHAFTGAFII